MQTAVPAGRQIADRALVASLGHRYGDGIVYLSEASERELFDAAVQRGYVNASGYLIPAGRTLLARYAVD
tara:strand:- start:255 stop:464 length:210 start_codon:yes stop_codon:yes gene_type:complete